MKRWLREVFLDKDFHELFNKGFISFILRIGGQILGFLLTFIIAYYFGAKGLGDYVLAIILLRMFTLISKLGLDTTSIRFIASFASKNKWESIKHVRQKILVLLVVTTLISSAVMYFNATWLGNTLGIKIDYIRLNAFLVLPMAFFVLHYQSLRGLKRITEFSFFYRMSETVFTIISMFVIMQFIDDSSSKREAVPIYSYVTSICIVSILAVISYIYWFRIKSKAKNEESIDVIPLKNILKISLPLMFAQSVQFIMAWTDKLMLGSMMSSEDVGIYHIAFKLSMFANISLMAINSIAAPKFSELYANNNMERLRKVAVQSTKIIFWTTLPLVLLFFIFPSFFLGIFGKEFNAPIAISAFLILSLGKLIGAFSGSVGNLLQMTGKQVIFMNILIAGAVINIVLNYILIPHYGIKGAAIASMISMSFWNLTMVYFVKKEFGFITFYIPFIKR